MEMKDVKHGIGNTQLMADVRHAHSCISKIRDRLKYVSNTGRSTGGYDSSTVQDLMLSSVARQQVTGKSVRWLTDNGLAYTAHETMKEDYIAFMPKPDVRTALLNLAEAFTPYNDHHPHSALGYHPRENTGDNGHC